MRTILLWIALASLAFAQPSAKIAGPESTPPGEMVVLTSVGSVGDNLVWIKPSDLQTLQVGCSLLDTQVVFATSKPGRYEFWLIAADKEARIDYARHVVEVKAGGSTPPHPPTNPPTNPPQDPPTTPPSDSKWDGLKAASKANADKANDATTRSKLKAAIAALVLDLSDRLPPLGDAKVTYLKEVEAVLLLRSGASLAADWVSWRKGNQAELDRLGIVDTRDYINAIRAIGGGL